YRATLPPIPFRLCDDVTPPTPSTAVFPNPPLVVTFRACLGQLPAGGAQASVLRPGHHLKVQGLHAIPIPAHVVHDVRFPWEIAVVLHEGHPMSYLLPVIS